MLGQSMSRLNEVEEATIFNVFLGIIFTLYMIANLPFRRGYQNYRAIVVQSTALVILCITMYYRSMKGNSSAEATYKIVKPGLIELSMIVLSFAVSAVCLGYEFYLKYIKKPLERPSSSPKVEPVVSQIQEQGWSLNTLANQISTDNNL